MFVLMLVYYNKREIRNFFILLSYRTKQFLHTRMLLKFTHYKNVQRGSPDRIEQLILLEINIYEDQTDKFFLSK